VPSKTPALLVLADGSVFRGTSVGAAGRTVGEVVFNTAMTGYQEILTDPSYAGQIVTLTYPHIGNTGANSEDEEAAGVHAAGLVIRDLPRLASNFRRQKNLSDYLVEAGVPGIAGIDTRKLTRILREKGAQAGCILAGEDDEAKALVMARAFPGLAGMDLAKVVSATEGYEWTETEWATRPRPRPPRGPEAPRRRLRLRRQAQHPSDAGQPRLPRHRGAGADPGGRGAQAATRRRLPEQRPG